MSKRILSLVLALVMVLGTFGTVFAAETGSDKIDWLVEQGIVKGDASGNLMLDKNIDRASVAKMVVEALGQQAAAAGMQGVKSIFPDVPAGHWSNGNINIVSGLGLMKGNAKGQFMPSAEISYAEVVTILVRMSKGFTAEEEKAAVWPASYIAKANELGILEDITVANFSAAAVRKDILEMFYNAMINMEVGKYSVVKGIVLENYRVERLDKDKVLVEILKEVKKADYVEQSRKEKGDQVTLTIPTKVADVEDLLGRVADFTVDKNNNVVAIKIDETYKVETGAFEATKNKMGKYTVELPERYNKADETIFRTYYNNKPYAYEDFYKNPDSKDRKDEFEVDYARVTVKNGKVLFIDAFNFEDIAPVKEVKEDGKEVYVYNDARDGSVKRYDLKTSTSVLLINEDKVGLGSIEDIKANDVIHEFKGGFIVRKDAKVDGKFEKVSENRDGEVFVHVDGKEYLVSVDSNKKPVYAFKSETDFYTLEAKEAAGSLKEFRGENVTALIDLSGNLQYIGSEIELGEFVGIVTRLVGRDVRVLKTDGKTYDYSATLDTKVNSDRVTGHQGLNDIKVGNLVFMSVDGEKIDKIIDLTARNSSVVDKLTTREIQFKNEATPYRILDDTIIFVVQNGRYEVRKAADVEKAFDKKSTGIDVEAYVVNAKQFRDESRRPGSDRTNEAYAIVFTAIELQKDLKSVVVEYDGFVDRQESEMRVVLSDRTRETRKLTKDVKFFDIDGNEVKLSELKLKGGDIIEVKQTKDDNKDIEEVRLVIKKNTDDVFAVADYDRSGNIVLKDKNDKKSTTYYVDNKTAIFGANSLSSARKVKFALESSTSPYVKAIIVVSDSWDTTGDFGGTTPSTGEYKLEYTSGDYVNVTLKSTDVESDFGVIVNNTVVPVKGGKALLENPVETDKLYKLALVKVAAPDKVLVEKSFFGLSTADATSKEKVAADKAELEIVYTTGDSATSVTDALTLKTAGTKGSVITWESSNTAIIKDSTGGTLGEVTRPAFADGNKTVTLTANIKDGNIIETKTFTVVVIADVAGDADKVALDKAALKIEGDLNNVTADLKLAATGANGTAITWTSSHTNIIEDSTGTAGKVVRPEGANVQVTLTAQIKSGSETATKVFYVTVIGQ